MYKPRVWLDAGHGGTDSGAVGGNNRYEKDDNLAYALELEKQFKVQGIDVMTTRTTDTALSLNHRTKLERDNNCNLAIACHRNGFNNPTANGFEIWLHSNAPQSYIDWATEIAFGISKFGMKNRGVYRGFRENPQANYYANSGTNSPSMLIELGFITNENDNQIFDTKLSEMCEVIVKASCSFLKIEYISEPKPVPPTQTTVPIDEYAKIVREKNALLEIINKIKDLVKGVE